MSGVRAILPPGFQVIGPTYHSILHTDGTLLSCERHGDGRLVNCKIDGRPVTPQEYVDRKDAWKNG